jgi:hypothetical protein
VTARAAGYVPTMAKHLRKGTHVRWNTRNGPTEGRVERRLTSPTTIKGHRVAASPDEPQYLVESDRTGAEAAHKPDALRRV